MNTKLIDFRVEDVISDGKYKVRHKTTNDVFIWVAHECGSYSEEQIQNIFNEVKTIASLSDGCVLRYYDTILHAPAKVIYFVMELEESRTLEDFISECIQTDKTFNETYLWHILYNIAKVCKLTFDMKISMFRKRISASCVFINRQNIKVNCFSLQNDDKVILDFWQPIYEIGRLVYRLCYLEEYQEDQKIEGDIKHSDDLRNILEFMLSKHTASMKPDALIFHPTVQINLNNNLEGDILLGKDSPPPNETPVKAGSYVDLRKTYHSPLSPNYVNVSWHNLRIDGTEDKEMEVYEVRKILSPTLSALALELPGYKPKMSSTKEFRAPQQITDEVLNQQWLNRLKAIRDREEALNRRERELIDREIANSPGFKMTLVSDESRIVSADNSPHINDLALIPKLTLQPVMSHKALPTEIESNRTSLLNRSRPRNSSGALVPNKPQRRSTSLRAKNRRKKIYSYEDLDSSLSAADMSVVATTTKLSSEVMPRPSLFENPQRKKVHFTRRNNPFAEYLDVSGTTYTFYELENVDHDGYQVPRKSEFSKRNIAEEISKFKYLDLERMTCEKRSAMETWVKSSPKKLSTNIPENLDKPVLADITNFNKQDGAPVTRRGCSRMSITSKISNSSTATKSSKSSKCSEGSQLESIKSIRSFLSYNTRSTKKSDTSGKPNTVSQNDENVRLSKDNKDGMKGIYTDVKKPKSRKSLLPFKTPFKFR